MRNSRLIPAGISAAMVLAPAALVVPQAGYAERDEIVVSVRRKEENLQEVPLSVTTIGEGAIERFGIENLDDVVKYSAGLEFDEGFGAQDTRVVIRGLSPTRGRANVAFLVDGVDFSGEAVSTAGGGILVNQQLLDVERVEIVKGPQSALYGRSAFGGAIQYVTKKPSLEEFEGSVSVDYGINRNFRSDTRDTKRIAAAAGGPITENFGLRVNGIVYDNDGYYNNTVTGEAVGGSEGHGIALSGLWEASDSLTISGRIASSNDEYEQRAQARVASNLLVDLNDSVAVVAGVPGPGQTNNLINVTGPAAFAGGPHPDCATASTNADGTITSCLGTPKVLVAGVMPDRDQLRVVQNENPRTGSNYPGTDVDTLTFTLQADWELSSGKFSSTTGYVDLDSTQLIDGQFDALQAGTHSSLDGSYMFTLAPCGFSNCSPAIQEIDFRNNTKLFSQEFRYASALDGPINYTVGALFWNEDVKQVENSTSISPSIFRVPAPFPPGLPLPVESAAPGNSILAGVFSPNLRSANRDTQSISAYGLIEWDFRDDMTFSFEARWIDEELDVSGDVCDVAATEALTGYPTQTDPGGNDFCWQSFRGGSSAAEVLAPGTSLGGPFGPFVGAATLPVGTYTKAVTMLETARFSDSYIAPKATLEWQYSDTQLFYGSIAQGIKPGGISTITAGAFFAPDQNVFDKEKLLAFEVGSKSTLLDGAMVVNAALFYQDYTDKQVGVTRFDPIIQTDVGAIENAGEAEIFGLELEAQWQVTDQLTVSAGYSYVDAEYTDFIIETSSANNVARSLAAGDGGCLRIIDNDPAALDGQSDNCVVDLTGNEIEDVPKHSFVGNITYVAPLADTGLEWLADASVLYRDERAMDEFNVKYLDSYYTVDVRGGLIGENWQVIAFINNFFDDDTVKTGVDFGSQVNTLRQGQWPPGPTDGVVVSLPDPRVIGVRATYNF